MSAFTESVVEQAALAWLESVAEEAVEACRAGGVEPIVGGCPLMYCQPVDPAHRAFRWWLRLRRRVPA